MPEEIVKATLTQEQLNNIAMIIYKLQGLGIKAAFKKLEEGPIITGYYITPAPGTPVRKIFNHSEDFAIACKVDKVTLTRDKGDIIIFIPNETRKTIDFKEVLAFLTSDPRALACELPIPLGVNHLGEKAVLDLTTQPHILIAGQTGSGKSVFESSIIASLAIAKDPSDLEMILVDTKGVDLTLFDGLKHVSDIIKTLADFRGMLCTLLEETRLRMARLNGSGVRNIKEYNNFVEDKAGLKMKYKVLVIDELADIIMQDREFRRENPQLAKDVEPIGGHLQTLLQICRAAGIHVICCTQRSSVKIISGDIKANLPCRIALRLPTRDDSKTILGTNGAETLLGKGDMLVQHEGSEILHRYHAPYVRLEDIQWVVMDVNQAREVLMMSRGLLNG